MILKFFIEYADDFKHHAKINAIKRTLTHTIHYIRYRTGFLQRDSSRTNNRFLGRKNVILIRGRPDIYIAAFFTSEVQLCVLLVGKNYNAKTGFDRPVKSFREMLEMYSSVL